jgi:hypothetical protein
MSNNCEQWSIWQLTAVALAICGFFIIAMQAVPGN